MSCEKVLSVHYGEEGDFVVTTDQGEYQTCSLILATGVSRVRPGIANLDEYDGKGVSYCVSCDGFFYRNKKVLVLGEGIFAANQALELTQYTNDVAICSQGKNLTITDEFLDRIKDATEKGAEIEIIEKKIETLEGDNGLERVVFTDGEKRDADGLFIAMGEASSTDFAYSLGLVTEGQFIKVDYDMKTNIPGIFAAGDCVGGFLQIAVAVGEGAKAGRAAISHIRKVCHKKQKEKAAAAG
jgi:thioredoxin reductase (NADPH)